MQSNSTPEPGSSRAVLEAEAAPEIQARLEEIAHRSLGVTRTIARDDTLIGTLGLDSLSLLSLAVEVEDRFRIRLGEDEQYLRTVGDLCDLIERRLAEARQ